MAEYSPTSSLKGFKSSYIEIAYFMSMVDSLKEVKFWTVAESTLILAFS